MVVYDEASAEQHVLTTVLDGREIQARGYDDERRETQKRQLKAKTSRQHSLYQAELFGLRLYLFPALPGPPWAV